MERLPNAEILRTQSVKRPNDEDAILIDTILAASEKRKCAITYSNLTEKQKCNLKRKGYTVEDWGIQNSIISWE